MPASVPWWVRALMASTTISVRGAQLHGVLVDELIVAGVPKRLRGDLSLALYARERQYARGGAHFERGLMDWERQIVESPAFPKSGRVLVGGAGGGREVEALLSRGYEVVAFDPCAELAAELARVEGAAVACASYGDLIAHASGGGGALRALVQGRPFDAIVLGLASFGHVLEEHDRRALLRACRLIAPFGPVVVSFFLRGPAEAHAIDRLRRRVRAALSTLRGGADADDGLTFLRRAGFMHFFTRNELYVLAAESGYDVETFDAVGEYPHITLRPTT